MVYSIRGAMRLRHIPAAIVIELTLTALSALPSASLAYTRETLASTLEINSHEYFTQYDQALNTKPIHQ